MLLQLKRSPLGISRHLGYIGSIVPSNPAHDKKVIAAVVYALQRTGSTLEFNERMR
jgi:hypothetical protein